MSVVARRLSACVPQEVLGRRASPTAQDLSSQMCHFDSAFLSPHPQESGSSVHSKTPTLPHIQTQGQNSSASWRHVPYSASHAATHSHDTPMTSESIGSPITFALNAARRLSCRSGKEQQGGLSPDHLANRRRSFDVTLLSAEAFPEDKRRSSLRSPLWRTEHRIPTPELLMGPQGRQRLFSASHGQRFLGRAWQLEEERDEGRSATVARGLRAHHLDLLSPILPSQQRRQSWGPSVFSPSPGDTHSFQTPVAASSVSPSPTISPDLLSLPYVVSPHATLPPVPVPSEESVEDAETEGKKGLSKRAVDVVTTGECHTSSVMPDVTIDSAGSPATCVPRHYKGHSEELYPPKEMLTWEWSAACPFAAPPRRASWHTSSPATSSASFDTTHCTRCHQATSHLSPANHSRKTMGTVCQCRDLPRPKTGLPGSVLGKGGFGIVKLGSYKGRGVAVKVLKGRRAAATSTREAKALSLSPHAHLAWTLAVVTHTSKDLARVSWAHLFDREEEVVSQQTVTAMFSLSTEDAQGTWCGEQQQQQGDGEAPWWAWVVSELCLPHTLLTLINDTSMTLTSEMRIRYTLEVCRGLAHLHAQGVAHRDLKPANVLLTVSGHLKIADFGCCARLDQHNDDIVLGTVRYQAPEVLRGQAGGSHSDVFSLGVTIWHLLTRTLPYHGLHPHIVIYQVANLRHRPTDHQPHQGPLTFLDAVLWRIVHSCWTEEPALRPTAAALCRNLTLLYLASSPHKVGEISDIRVSCSSYYPSPSLLLPPPSPLH